MVNFDHYLYALSTIKLAICSCVFYLTKSWTIFFQALALFHELGLQVIETDPDNKKVQLEGSDVLFTGRHIHEQNRIKRFLCRIKPLSFYISIFVHKVMIDKKNLIGSSSSYN